jgi:hypothetical protein
LSLGAIDKSLVGLTYKGILLPLAINHLLVFINFEWMLSILAKPKNRRNDLSL